MYCDVWLECIFTLSDDVSLSNTN